MNNFKTKSIFALGPAPPGHRPPNTALFLRLESHLLSISRRMKETTARIDRLRSAHRIGKCTATRLTIKEQVRKEVKDQIQARVLFAKYSLKLKALQEAEILKVVGHMHGIDTICQEKSNTLALLRVIIQQETDPVKIRSHQQDIHALVREQEKARDLRDRWKVRLLQMEDAKVKVPTSSTGSKLANASKEISTPKPKTETKSINKVMEETIRKNAPSPKPRADAKPINNGVAENMRKNDSPPKPKAFTEATNKVVTEKIKNNVSPPKPKAFTVATNKVVTENIRSNLRRISGDPKVSPPKPKAFTEAANKVVTEKIKYVRRISVSTPKPKAFTEATNKVVTENIRSNIRRISVDPKVFTQKTGTEASNKILSENLNKKTDKICSPKTVPMISKEQIGKRQVDNVVCKRCAFLQRANKNNKNLPKYCKVCLKWAHKVLQDGVKIVPKKKPINKAAAPKSVTILTRKPDLNTDVESMIKVEIEPVTDFSIMQESVTQMDLPKSSHNEEIEPLDASMNDEIMSNVIKEEETENIAKTKSIDFKEVALIQDGLKAIDDKNTALAHVRILQEYAMLNDNYRAIGLLSEVEAALINPPKTEDFEC